MTGRWGSVPLVLSGPAASAPVLTTPAGVSLVDQKRAHLREWLSDREVEVLDPESLRYVLLGADLLAEEIARAAAQGLLPRVIDHVVRSTSNGLVVALEPYLPEEARRG